MNLLSLLFILVAIFLYYQNNSFSLIVKIMVVIAVIFGVISGYLRLRG